MTVISSASMRRFIATLAAGATAFALMTAAAAVPARASGSDDLAKALAAVAAIAIIGAAVNDNRKDKAKVHIPHQPPQVVHGRNRNGHHWGAPARPRHGTPHRGHKPRAVTLPANCAVQMGGRHGPQTAYLARCLDRAGIDRNLPRRCEIPVRLRGQRTTAYDQNCLIGAGFRVQGRHRY
jgi:hypothetical protein